jgi:hypothetical protein
MGFVYCGAIAAKDGHGCGRLFFFGGARAWVTPGFGLVFCLETGKGVGFPKIWGRNLWKGIAQDLMWKRSTSILNPISNIFCAFQGHPAVWKQYKY